MTRSGLSARYAAALVLVVVAVGCRSTAPKETVGPQLLLGRLRAAVVPGGTERIEVTAADERNQPVPFSVECDNEAVATVTKTDSTITVTGQSRGTANVTVSCGGSRRTFPVQVYDPMVLETDELLIRFVDVFAWRWNTSGYRFHGTISHPVTTDGFKALGSVCVPYFARGPQDDRPWAVVVKARPGSDALKPPLDYVPVWDTKATGTGPGWGMAENPGSLWDPVPPSGYRALGTVAQAGYDKPSLDDVVCVREDLTVPGVWGKSFVTWGGSDYADWGARPILPPNVGPHDLCYLPTGAFVACPQSGGLGSSPSRVLKIKLPVLAEAQGQRCAPKLAERVRPPDFTPPTLAREVLVPWILVNDPSLSDSERIRTSPFYRLERQVCYKRIVYEDNTTSLTQTYEVKSTVGITTSESQTVSSKTGVEVSVEAGVSCEFKGFGADVRVGVTVSKELGYEMTWGNEEFISQEITKEVSVAPGKAAAKWQEYNLFVLKRHDGTELVPVHAWQMGIESYVDDEYPDE